MKTGRNETRPYLRNLAAEKAEAKAKPMRINNPQELITIRDDIKQMQQMIDAGKEFELNEAQARAIFMAIGALERFKGNKKSMAVLKYHAEHPRATMFRDNNTIDALCDGLQALKKYEEWTR